MWSLRTKYSASDYAAPSPYSPRGSPQRSGSDGWLAKSLSPPQSPRRVGGANLSRAATAGSSRSAQEERRRIKEERMMEADDARPTGAARKKRRDRPRSRSRLQPAAAALVLSCLKLASP